MQGPTSPAHTGEWRDQRVTANYCALDRENFGRGSTRLCQHIGVITGSHWSCCGNRNRSADICAANQPPLVAIGGAGAVSLVFLILKYIYVSLILIGYCCFGFIGNSSGANEMCLWAQFGVGQFSHRSQILSPDWIM